MFWKKMTLLSLLGFTVGVLIGIGFSLSDWHGLREAFPHLLMGGLYGAVACGSSIVYEIEKWSLARATATHFLLVFALYFLIAFTMDWFRPDDPEFWILIGAMVVAYVMIWLLQYRSYQRAIRQMNSELDRMKKRADDE